ncbi:MAG: hypothetical protein ACPGTQ_00615 [Colwellia sp.]
MRKRRSGFYIGSAVAFLGYLLHETTGSNRNTVAISALLLDSSLFSIVSGFLFLLGFSALAGRSSADNINSEKRDVEVRNKVNQEVATETLHQSKHKHKNGVSN